MFSVQSEGVRGHAPEGSHGRTGDSGEAETEFPWEGGKSCSSVGQGFPFPGNCSSLGMPNCL